MTGWRRWFASLDALSWAAIGVLSVFLFLSIAGPWLPLGDPEDIGANRKTPTRNPFKSDGFPSFSSNPCGCPRKGMNSRHLWFWSAHTDMPAIGQHARRRAL